MGYINLVSLALFACVSGISGRFVFPLAPVETSTGIAADLYLRPKAPEPVKEELASSNASPVGTRVAGRRYERIQENYQPSEPYNFGYDVRDDYGNRQYRKEESDASGTVRGSYGYTDANGLFRIVEYVADLNGFRANIKTNEPGTGNQPSADIILAAEVPPRAILEAASAPKPVTEEPPKDSEKASDSPVRPYERLLRPIVPAPIEPNFIYRTAYPLPSTSSPAEEKKEQ